MIYRNTSKEVMVLNIAIIGAGKGGTNLIESLAQLEDVRIELVVDPNTNAPGIILAEKLRIQHSQSMFDIRKMEIDMIIEATGKDQVIENLYNEYGNSHKIIDSQGALLLMTLVDRDAHTLKKLNNQMEAINITTALVDTQISEISTSINEIQNINNKLTISTKTSTEHIKNSDKIIQYVNNIAKQIKILGINATIEAARAGEHGRGFSVVANEIQNLANNSAKFANEINNILIQLSKEMENINQEVQLLDAISQTQVLASEKVNHSVEKLVKVTAS